MADVERRWKYGALVALAISVAIGVYSSIREWFVPSKNSDV